MDHDEAKGGWTYPCRCGEAFRVGLDPSSVLPQSRQVPHTSHTNLRLNTPRFHPSIRPQVLEEELLEGASILVTCDGCSLRARVRRSKPPPSASPPPSSPAHHHQQQQSKGEASATPQGNATINGCSVLRPTRGQAELDEDANTNGSQQGPGTGGRRRREEPRSVEEAGPLRVLYEGHDLLIIDKVRQPDAVGFNKKACLSMTEYTSRNHTSHNPTAARRADAGPLRCDRGDARPVRIGGMCTTD